MKADEEFKDCPYNPSVQVSQYGRVRTKDGNMLNQTSFKEYLIVEDPSNQYPLERVHRLVALTWLHDEYLQKNKEKKKEEYLIVHHKDGNGFNNFANNLEWRTNGEHAVDHGWDGVDEHGAWIKGY
jgi:hypothetical protein